MRMMFLIFYTLLSTQAWGQVDVSTERELKEQARAAAKDQGPEDFLKGTGVRLSSRYFIGGVLVYDCVDRHFVCTSVESADECRDKRADAITKDRFELPCAPLKAFENHEVCVKEQYKRVHEIPLTAWCYNDKKLRF